MTTTSAPDLGERLLDAARQITMDARSAQLGELGRSLVAYVDAVGADALLARIPPGTERVAIASSDGGPLLALRRYGAGDRSTVHSHAWTVLVQLSGEAVFERWIAEIDGTATFGSRHALAAGSVTPIGAGEPHRQSASTDMVELVLIARYDDSAPKVDHEPRRPTSRHFLDRVVARADLGEHDGRSGARLERLTLDDGSTLVQKRAAAGEDLGGVLGIADAELVLWESGAFERFPPELGHPVLDKWLEGDEVVTLMRDLGASIPGWTRSLSGEECRRVFEAAAALHRTFAGEPPGVVELERRLGLLSPRTMAPLVGTIDLAGAVVRGWERFADLVDADVLAAVGAVHDEPGILAAAFGDAPRTLVHADLWPVNLAIDEAGVTFLDWSVATAGPAALECSVFLSGAADHVELRRDEVIDAFRRASGDLTDDRSMQVALLAGLCDLGWNKALDAAEHDDPVHRARAAADLAWWVDAGRVALDAGLVPAAAVHAASPAPAKASHSAA